MSSQIVKSFLCCAKRLEFYSLGSGGIIVFKFLKILSLKVFELGNCITKYFRKKELNTVKLRECQWDGERTNVIKILGGSIDKA